MGKKGKKQKQEIIGERSGQRWSGEGITSRLASLDNFFFLFPQWEAWSQSKYAAVIELACKSFRRAGIRTLTFAINRCIALSACWELVIKLVRNIPGHIEKKYINSSLRF